MTVDKAPSSPPAGGGELRSRVAKLERENASLRDHIAGLKADRDRLRDGLRERGFGAGRNPDGVEQSVDTALHLIDMYRAAAEQAKRGDMPNISTREERSEKTGHNSVAGDALLRAVDAALEECP